MVGFKQVYNLLPAELCEKVYSYYDKDIKSDFNRVIDELRQTVREKSIWRNPSERLISLCCGLGMFQFSYRTRYGSPVLCEPMFDTHLSDNFNHMFYVNWNFYDEYIDIRIVSEDMKEEDYEEDLHTTKTRFILSEDQGFLKFGGIQKIKGITRIDVMPDEYDDFVLGHDVDLNVQQINEIYDKNWNIKNNMYVDFDFIYTDENLIDEEWNKNKFKDVNKVFV